MESLYTKYRPQTFADVVGQQHVVSTLQRAVLEGRTSHAYLFCGPRGTGKTTMARLLAKALMCEQGPGHLPDGSCEQCKLIAAGEHPDVYELDAASRTGVDNVREEIISRVSFAPVRARYKMYIIDEVHMLTTAAFNALLKTLEEPPAHVVFVLCTTDPQKIPETILSRVQRFDFHAIGNADIQARLAYICDREGFSYDEEALELVVRHARGGMRDAISELEQLSVSGGGAITVDVARDVLGEVSASTLQRMSLAMANRDVPTLFAQVESLVEVGRDLLQFTRALAARLRDVYVVTAIGAKSGVVQAADDELPAISREAAAFGSVDRVARALELLSDASTEMRVAPNQRLVLEVALTKIARPQSELTLEALADRVSTLERQVTMLAQSARQQMAAGAAAPKESPRTKDAGDARRPSEASALTETRGADEGLPVAQAPEATAPQRQEEAQNQSQPSSATPPTAPAPWEQAPAEEPVQPLAQSPVQATPSPTSSAQSQDQMQFRPQTAASWQQDRASNPQLRPQTPSQQVQAPASPPQSAQPQGGNSWQEQPSRDVGHGAAQPSAGERGVAPAASSAPVAAPAAPQLPVSQQVSPTASTAITDPGELQRRWKQVVDSLLAQRPQHGSLLMSSTIISDDGERLTVTLPKGSGFAFRMLERADVRQSIDPMIAQVFGPRKTRFGEGAPIPGAAASTTTATQRPQTPTHQGSTRQTATAVRPQVPAPQPVSAARPTPSAAAMPPQSAAPVPTQPVVPTATPTAYTKAASPAAGSGQGAASVGRPLDSQPSPTPVQSTHYVAPWEPQPLDEDMVPYDDYDASPYEEEYAFDEGASATVQSAGSASQPTPAWASQSSVGLPQAPSTSRPSTAIADSAPSSPTIQDATPSSAPVQPSAPTTTTTPVLESAPSPQPKMEPTSAPASESNPVPASTPKPKARRSRKVSGIPADVISMMTEIFGEGISYTAEPPADEDEAYLVDSEAVADDADGSSEYADEPVDDADYETDD